MLSSKVQADKLNGKGVVDKGATCHMSSANTNTLICARHVKRPFLQAKKAHVSLHHLRFHLRHSTRNVLDCVHRYLHTFWFSRSTYALPSFRGVPPTTNFHLFFEIASTFVGDPSYIVVLLSSRACLCCFRRCFYRVPLLVAGPPHRCAHKTWQLPK